MHLDHGSALQCTWIMRVHFSALGSRECTSVHLDHGMHFSALGSWEFTSVHLDHGSALNSWILGVHFSAQIMGVYFSALGSWECTCIMGVHFSALGPWQCTSVHLDHESALQCTWIKGVHFSALGSWNALQCTWIMAVHFIALGSWECTLDKQINQYNLHKQIYITQSMYLMIHYLVMTKQQQLKNTTTQGCRLANKYT